MSKNEGEPRFFLFRWLKGLALTLIGLFAAALIHSMVAKWAEANGWDQFLIHITGPPLSTISGYLISQQWFWLLAGLSGGVVLGIRVGKLAEKSATKGKGKVTIASSEISLLKTGLQIDFEGVEHANIVETESDVFVRVRVRNMGSKTLKNARVFLTSLKEVHTSGATVQTSLHDATPLPWAGFDFNPRELPPISNADHYVDLMRVSKSEPGWIICARQVFADQTKLRRYRGTYRFHVTLTADNAEPATCGVDVNYLGDWHNLRAVAAPTPGKT